jgi:UDPglucose 6-dehydrogenase
MKSDKIIDNKSTVPIGTAGEVARIIKQNQRKAYDYDVVSNPEFLREGDAIRDFSSPDRIVVGTENERSRSIMEALYKGITRTGKPILFTNTQTAELIKYASNAMLATRISFMNHLVPLCEKTGADIKQVAKGMGLDARIGPRFLQAGVGYGGSCFPKDIGALVWMMERHGCSAQMLRSVIDINNMQKKVLISKVQKLVPKLENKSIAIWGLSFKPKTDDIRDAPSLIMIQELIKLGAKVKVFDPEAMDNAKKILNNVEFCKTPYDAVKNCSAVLLVTEWNVFRDLDLNKVKTLMKSPNIIDGRNIYDRKDLQDLGFNYECVGR